VLAGELTVGQLVMFLSYLGLFYTPINEIHSLNHMLQHALAASERVFEILDTKPEVEDRPGAVPPVERLRGAVEYRHVGFGYRKDGTVLSDVNLTVRPGERIALVGPSGAGKTSLLKLLMRFYDVRSGAVLVDGHDVRELPLDFLRGRSVWCSRSPFSSTAPCARISSIATSRPAMSVWKRPPARREPMTLSPDLPDGYDSWIGERGVKLSVGQKQRVSIARVLLKDPPIVIFDEATSNIDTETEVKIREALNDLTKGRTTFIIAHRLATLHDVDRIIVVERGTIVEEGDHEALMKRGGVYAGLYEAQFKI
jgi:ABC-type multidrug transport system fused ATPase/permease subunit